MGIILGLIINSLAVFIAAQILPDVSVANLSTALIVAVVLGLINTFVKPIVTLITLPINLITLGVFGFIINVLIILLVSNYVPGFTVEGFVTAALFGFVLSLISSILGTIVKI